MALNIQSGSTWAEIRSELNNKTFDKNGDVLMGSVYDTNGNEALKIDADNQKISSYGVNGESICGEVLAVESGDISISIPKGMKRGMCVVETGDRYSESNGCSINAIVYFNTKMEQSKIVGWITDYDFRSYDRLAENSSDYVNAYIQGEELKVSISPRACERGNLNIYWEVW